MQKPRFPDNEQGRLDKLHSLKIMDSESDERFDRVTRMAKRLFGVPTAVVSLIDQDRQWSMSCAGGERSEAPREISFCGHTILEEEMMVIENALEDSRFVDNPLVTEAPDIRFYAGCPLKVDGYTLGTLCIIDQQVREFRGDDVEALKDLGAMVSQELTVKKLATIDELTGISNRSGFISLSDAALSLCSLQGKPASLMFLDLDNFKPINDEFGHVVGDEVLTQFATLMKDTFRDYDLVARLSGDEFVALFSGTTADEADVLVGRLSKAVEQHSQQEERDINVGFSHGIVEFDPKEPTTTEALLAAGDALMYEKKRAKTKQS